MFARTLISIYLILAFGCNKNEKPIKIGLNPWPGYAPLIYAQHLGLFKKYDLNIKIHETPSLSDMKMAFNKGEIDVICASFTELISLYDTAAIKLKPLIIADYSNGPDVIIGRGIRSIKDLKNKKVGTEFSLGIFMLARALELSGMTTDDVEMVPLHQSKMKEAFDNGDVDAVIIYPPESVAILKESQDAIKIFSSSNIPYEVMDMIATSDKFHNENPEFQSKLLDVWDEVIRQIRKDDSGLVSFMAKKEGISEQEYRESMNGLIFLNKNEQRLVLGNLEKLRKNISLSLDVLKKTKAIEKNYTVDDLLAE